MAIECFVIVILIVVMSLLMLRRERKEYALSILPLVILPAVHLLSPYLLGWAEAYTRLDRQGVLVFADAVALVVSCLLIGALAVKIEHKRARNTLVIICGLFLVVLSFILISHILAV